VSVCLCVCVCVCLCVCVCVLESDVFMVRRTLTLISWLNVQIILFVPYLWRYFDNATPGKQFFKVFFFQKKLWNSNQNRLNICSENMGFSYFNIKLQFCFTVVRLYLILFQFSFFRTAVRLWIFMQLMLLVSI
jgi:hypothetical protein